MKTKKCVKCGEEKELSGFTKDNRRQDGTTGVCLLCKNLQRKLIESLNPEKYKEKRKKYTQEKKEEISLQRKGYYENNKFRFQESQKRRRKENPEKFNYYWKSEEHRKKHIKSSCESYARRLKVDGNLRMIKNLRTRLKRYMRQKNYRKEKGFFEIVGLSPEELKIYIENLFTEGMCWEKMGKEIHIDHIIPLSTAQNEEELYKLSHYTNLQPMWAKDNLIKGKKIL